ncbi:uncharacterized protein LOC143044535 [Mytilus galloprovincialis]|uniref:uncharacterized protein LOC143044535 n=1 Tax=Mytilus galloprovincialis TaxID=29158 RepID=UPI003F7C0E7C
MIAMFLIVVVSCLLSFSHEGSVATNTAECYRSEDILDCRDDAIKFFSGEIDPSINRVLMNHIMNSDQIENVRMKASCVFELSLSSKELCDTVQGKIIVLNGEECSSYDTTIETYSEEDVTSTEKMPLGISTIIGVKEIEEEEEGNTTHINGIYYILAVCVIGVLYLLPINPIFREEKKMVSIYKDWLSCKICNNHRIKNKLKHDFFSLKLVLLLRIFIPLMIY